MVHAFRINLEIRHFALYGLYTLLTLIYSLFFFFFFFFLVCLFCFQCLLHIFVILFYNTAGLFSILRYFSSGTSTSKIVYSGGLFLVIDAVLFREMTCKNVVVLFMQALPYLLS